MTVLKRLRAALYGRVSLDQHGNSPSPGRQQSVGEVHCQRNDWINAGIYGQGDESASRHATKARKEWARLIADIEAGRIDVVVVWEWSRADRNPTTGHAFLDLCTELGVLIHVASKRNGKGKTYDVKNDRDDWEELSIGLTKSAMEVDILKMRATDARRDRVEKGIVDGRIAYGYRRIYDPNTRVFIRQEEDPAQAPVVREIIRRVIAGEPLTVISDDLTKRKVPTPGRSKTWLRCTVRDVALNPAYISRRRVSGKLWPVDWPAIVCEADHHAAVAILTDPKRKTTRPGRAVHLLSYIATCAVCEAPLNVGKGGTYKDGTPRRLYICTEGQCAAITVATLDEAVTDALFTYLADPKVYEALTRTDNSAGAEIRNELAGLDAELKAYQAMAGTGVDPTTIGEAVRKINARIADAEGRRDAVVEASGALQVLLGDRAHSGDELAARWEAKVGVAQRRQIIRELLTVKLDRLKSPEPGEANRRSAAAANRRHKRIVIEPRAGAKGSLVRTATKR